ncbi:MAG: AAA family ATPase [Candidatus Cloacimonetes bacterium 4572_55]|nr:MAG: AAA family ATPase [Candidatus Cloacimonetes bacterium 4572_55]
MNESFLKSLPGWAKKMVEKYYTQTISQFILYGNVYDLAPWRDNEELKFLTLHDFLAKVLFGSRDIIMFYDRSSGIDFATPAMRQDFSRAISGYDSYYGTEFSHSLPRDPQRALHLIFSYLRLRIGDGKSIAVIIDYADTIIPNSDSSMMSDADRTHFVTLLKLARDSMTIQSNATICLITESLGSLNQDHVKSVFTEGIQIPPPNKRERSEYIKFYNDKHPIEQYSEVPLESLASLTSGLSRVSLRTIMAEMMENKRKLTFDLLKQRKKLLIEAESFGLLEFVETKYDLDMVAGHDGVKKRLRDAVKAIQKGKTDVLPMGYLISGPVGTGKTFITYCFAGEVGIPCVILKNFRSQWVGQTESNLEKILSLLKAMEPIAVLIDEADAYLGNRSAGGDSGVSARVFSKIAAFMGNTKNRGKVIWFLMTTRPDLLPVDLKRQGRAEEHFGLFYPQTIEERKTLFQIMCKKTGVALDQEDIYPEKILDEKTHFSGADIEAGLIRSRFQAVVNGRDQVSQEDMNKVFKDFIPASYPLEIELQNLVAVQESTSRELLPKKYKKMSDLDVSQQIQELKMLIDAGRM